MWAKPQRSGGLRICGHRGHVEVRAAVKRFAKWLRTIESYPVRVPVYLSAHQYLRTLDDQTVSASFLAPFDPTLEPYIRIATGDYPDLLAKHGRDNALSMNLHSLAHELVHYRQWIETGEISERGVVIRARNIVNQYALTTDHP